MTQYLLAVHGRTDDPVPSDEEIQKAYAAVDVFNAKLEKSGALVFGGGLEDVSTAKVVDGRGGANTVTDGPYSEAKEVLGGFWVIEAPSLEAALDLAREGSAACGNAVEVRPFQAE